MKQWAEVVKTTEKIKKLNRSINAVTIVGDSEPSNYIPVVAVGYEGHTTLDSLQKRLDSTNENQRPDAALVIRSGCFIGFGMTATASFGLYGLAVSIDLLLRQLISARPDLTQYAKPQS